MDVRLGFLYLALGSFSRGDACEQGPEESDIEDEGRLVLAVPPPRSAAQAIPLDERARGRARQSPGNPKASYRTGGGNPRRTSCCRRELRLMSDP
jgi:hypothetical protein